MAGSQANGVNYLLDGGDNNDAFSNVNLPHSFPGCGCGVQRADQCLPAQYGLHPGGVVNIVTKSGTNGFHGDLSTSCATAISTRVPKAVARSAAGAGLTEAQSVRRRGWRTDHQGQALLFRRLSGHGQRSNPGTNTAHVPTALTIAGNFSVEDAPTSAGGCQSKAITLLDPSPHSVSRQLSPEPLRSRLYQAAQLRSDIERPLRHLSVRSAGQ